MTDDIRDTARPAGGSAETPAEPLPAPAGEGDAAAGPGAESFGAETLNAERLQAPEVPDYKDRWLRAEAELQNARRRAARDRDDAVRVAEDRVLIDVIELLDDLERALAALAPGQNTEPWAQGVALTAQRMRDALARRGVTPIATVGQLFDPAFHDALLEAAPPEGIRPGAVVQEVQKGYARDGRALRAARVVVAKSDH